MPSRRHVKVIRYRVLHTPQSPSTFGSPKTIFVLEELSLTYEFKSFRFDDSDAINQYLIEQYDTGKHLTYDELINRNLCNYGQSPYYGQCGWFQHLHAKKVQLAIDRYANEIKRVLGVSETVLSKKGDDEQWLVGNKMKYADMAFVLMQSWDEVFEGTPRMVELPSWKSAMDHRARLMDEQGLQWNGVPKGIETFTEYEEKTGNGEVKYG
ncbi:putative glutathione S-transferase [Triangularia setosa]|uniref:glutathione transferase n=1 Tax=Triangularia setosa TaxID=2587417 RepID=A0AAN6W8P9_9PEZI|nr:putative glutathione S-transferase [Podospora setosa]